MITRKPEMGFRCEGPCLPPPDFRLISYETRGFGASWPARDAEEQRRMDIVKWAADHGIWPQEAQRRWLKTGCWHE